MSMSSDQTERAHRLTIRRGGQSYRGRWRVVEDAVKVTSPYGVSTAHRGAEPPRALAETLLGELAFRWCAQTSNRH